MNKKDLKKLSKSELIKLLLKQEKKPETVMVEKPKKKQKKVYNHDNLFDDDQFPDFTVTSDPFEKPMIKANNKDRDINEQSYNINSRYQNLMSNQNDTVSTQKIRDYPMIKVSLSSLRKDELKRRSSNNKTGTSFIELFEKRLNQIQGDRETVSINLDVEIRTDRTDRMEDRKKYERLAKDMNNKGKDEYGIEYKKVIKQTTYARESIDIDYYIRKSYGPFTVEKPVNLSRLDIYKFAMYTLLKNKFTMLSQEVISGIGCTIIKLTKKQFKHHKMGKLKLESYLLNKQRPIKSHGVNTCVVDYVWDQVRGQRGFKTYTYDKLKSEIYDYVPEGQMISTEELINWANECHENLSIHAFDSRYRKFITYSKNCSNISLVYIVKDHHCYPITNEKLKIVASKASGGGCNDVLNHMSDLKWTRRHDNVTKIKSVDDICSLDKENHIVVLPENTKMKKAIDLYSRKEIFISNI